MKGENHPQCRLRGADLSVRTGANVSGHEFVETHNDGKTQALRCEVCGFESVGYFKEIESE